MRVFSQELSPQAVDVDAEVYDPSEFGRMIDSMDSFVAEDGGQPVGFCTVRLLDETTAEILCLNVNLDHIKQGIGTCLVRHVEKWIARRYPDISKLVLDTAVPVYNQKFWETMGYTKIGGSVCKCPRGRDIGGTVGKESSLR